MHVVSTAGHVDHGKSTLIRRLTGIDPDRLFEEKERGLTIDLGFAWTTLPSGREIGLVDVPGHERFIHNMLAGVGPIDTTVFAVAANEGWKPQSEEHLQILEMLGARGGVVALTKSDLAGAATIQGVVEQVRGRLAGTALDGCEVVPCSGKTGDGFDELVAALDRALERIGEPADRGRPRVFVDRVFTVKGAGTVVTGTLTGGPIRAEDSVVVLPAGRRARVRGIQTHKRLFEEARPVQRVALNLAGLERDQVRRGDAVVTPGQWEPATDIDVLLRAVRDLDHELTNRGAYKAHIGSAELDARVSLYETSTIRAGEQAFARLVLAQPVVAAPLDRFVLRDSGRRSTVGGGVVLDPHPPVLRGSARAGRTAQLRARAAGGRDDFPTLVVAERGMVPRADLTWLAGSEATPRESVSLRTLDVARTLFDELSATIERVLAEFHRAQPLLRGMPRDDARKAAGIRNGRLFSEVIEACGARITADGPLLRTASHRITLTLEQEAARDVLLGQLEGSGFAPPAFGSLVDTHGEALVRVLVEDGALVKIAEDIAFSSVQLERARSIIAEAIGREGPLTAARIKELLGTSRKFAIPLLEHLDATAFTKRRGDLRELAEPARAAAGSGDAP